MLITFINVPSLKETVMTVYPPVGILSMSSCLKREGNRVSFIDADVCGLEPSKVSDLLKKDPPQLIGVSLNVSQVSQSVRYIDEFQKQFPGIPIIVGGPYVTGVQEQIFNDFPSLNYAVVKEGEYAIVDFVEFLKEKRRKEDVRNLIYRADGKSIKNRCERIVDLDALPLPDYSLVSEHIRRYQAPYPSIASPSMAIMCARGCPFDCTFCSSPTLWDRRLIFRSTDSVIKEILYLRETVGVKEIFFQDDTLNARIDWFLELCDKIIDRGLHREIFFKCPFRVNRKILTAELLKKARKANFWMIFYGVENGNREMLRKMKKGITVEEIKRAFTLTRESGICSYASFMIGNYGETRETVRDSIALMRSIMPDFCGFAAAVPFPGSKLYDIAREKGLIATGDFKKYQYGDCIMKTDALGVDEIRFMVDEANRALKDMRGSPEFKSINSGNAVFTPLTENGLYPKEFRHVWLSRTGGKASVLLPVGNNTDKVCLKVLPDYPDISKEPVAMTLMIDDVEYKIELNKAEWQVIALPIVRDAGKNFVRIAWQVNRTWNPRKMGINNNDNRELGITVERIWVE